MTHTVPATAVLGPGKTGLTIGLRVLNLDGTAYSAFSTTGVSETSVPGTYRKANGAVVPDAGGYIVWGVSGTDYAEATVEGAAPTTAEILTAFGSAGNLDSQLGAINAKTTNLPAQPAAVGSPMTLADDAITAAKYDETTAFPVKQADTGDSTIARKGSGSETLTSLATAIDGIEGGGGEAGSGAITFTYTLTSTVESIPIAGADVWVTTDLAGTNVVASGVTDAFGQVVFLLDAGTYYVWRQLAGWTFANPDTEVVS